MRVISTGLAASLLAISLFVSPPSAMAEATAGGDPPLRWWKGNTHTHTFWSDGNDFPEMVTSWYREHGYHFLVLSDHNVLSRGEEWMPLAEIDKRSGGVAMKEYVAAFGMNWVETRGDRADGTLEVRLKPLSEYRALIEERGRFIMIEGEEITDSCNDLPVHLNAMNLAEVIPPQGGDSVRETFRRNLRAVMRQEEETGRPILVHFNHPNWKWPVTAEDLAFVVEERFFELFNGADGTYNNGDANHPSTGRLWDIANTIRLDKLDSPPMYGVGTDDSHHHHKDTDGAIPGRAWIVVRTSYLTPESIVRAMRAGDFYTSTGVVLEDVRHQTKSGKLSIRIKPTDGVTYTTRFIGTRRGYDDSAVPGTETDTAPVQYPEAIGEVLATIEGTDPEYVFAGDELYVRAEITSDRVPTHPTRENAFEKAWTQPVGWSVPAQVTMAADHRRD